MNVKRLFLVIILVLALSACQAKTPEPKPPTQTAEITYPPAPLPETAPYPGSVQPNMFPNYMDGDTLSWTDAAVVINSGAISKVVQTQSLQVTLLLKDGRKLITQEPALDDIAKAIQACGDLCKDIEIVNE
jgi:hypothetical protein